MKSEKQNNKRIVYVVLGGIALLAFVMLFNLPYGKFSPNRLAEAYVPPSALQAYDSFNGVQIFRSRSDNNVVSVYGDCRPSGGETHCDNLATFTPFDLLPRNVSAAADVDAVLQPKKSTPVYVRTSAGGWITRVYYLGIDPQHTNVVNFQVNVYNAGGQLMSDGLILEIVDRTLVGFQAIPGHGSLQ